MASTPAPSPDPAIRGGTAAAIRHHYDVSNEFYALWLDESLTYSCALWEPGDDPADLAAAQVRKLDYHLDQAGIGRAGALLDIGCGWGALLRRALRHESVTTAVGLTLSDAQFAHIAAQGTPRLEVRRESWIEHQPTVLYDCIVSIGALEHFASPGDSSAAKTALYREFFEKCRSWLSDGGAFSLQTIAFGTLQASEGNAFITAHIFPDSELPELHELVLAAKGVFELTRFRNDRADYAQTCMVWYQNLLRRRAEAVALVGEEKVKQYERYLRLSAYGFRTGKVELLRLTLRPLP